MASGSGQTPRTMSMSTGRTAPVPVGTPGQTANFSHNHGQSNNNVNDDLTAQLPTFQPHSRSGAGQPGPQQPGTSSGRPRDPVTGPERTDRMHVSARIPHVLPHERVFPIQIGSELFKLSGASLSSDSPSYFSQYFQCQIKTAENNGEDISTAIRTLYIDRDPVTFRDISLHLQGYHVQPRDGTHFVRLFADAQFYSLPRLISQLYEESIFVSIGHREFQVPRDLFHEPGNMPNYFSLGFAIFLSSSDDLFPGLDRECLIRPPSIMPPQVPNRSADTFAELLLLLQGYPLEIRNETHRQTLLRDCRYFNFKGLEQKLIPHALSFDQVRQRYEIALRLEDVLKSGISVASEPTAADPLAGWVNYARPFVDDKAAEMVLEIGQENTKLHFFPQPPVATPSSGSAASSPFSISPAAAGAGHKYNHTGIRAEFFRDTKTRIARMFEVIATKLNLPPTTQPLGLLMSKGGANSQPATPGNTPLSDDFVRVVLEPETAITLDGEPFSFSMPRMANDDDAAAGTSGDPAGSSHKRRRLDSSALSAGPVWRAGSSDGPASWIVKTAQWRLRIQAAKNGKSAVECVLVGVKLDAMSSELARNEQRKFL